MTISLKQLRKKIRLVEDFPKPGVSFCDITPLLADGDCLTGCIQHLKAALAEPPDIIVGIEARGFLLGAPLAFALGCGFVPARKPGKLPAATQSVRYQLEYGHDELHIHQDTILAGQTVVIVDDVLATGGTLQAAEQLIHQSQGCLLQALCLLEISALGGRQKLNSQNITCLLQY